MILNADPVRFCGLLSHLRKARARSGIDVHLLRLSARSLAQRDRHAATDMPYTLQPTIPRASLSLTKIVQFRHCLHPPNGGKT